MRPDVSVARAFAVFQSIGRSPSAQRILWLAVLLSVPAPRLLAQDVDVENQLSLPSTTGTPPYTTRDGAREDINLENGGLHVYIPAISLRGKGGQVFTLGFAYDSRTYTIQTNFNPSPGLAQATTASWVNTGYRNLHTTIPTLHASRNYIGTYYQQNPEGPPTPFYVYCTNNWIFYDEEGTSHSFANSRDCSNSGSSGGAQQNTRNIEESSDASFMRLDTTNPNDIIITAKDGTAYHFPGPLPVIQTSNCADCYVAVFARIVDTNGNTVTGVKNSDGSVTITDNLGRVITAGAGGITYKDSSGTSQVFVDNATLTGAPEWTFGTTSCNFITRTQTSAQQSLPIWTGANQFVNTFGPQESVILPVGSGVSYTLFYNSLGELTKIIYPSGGYTRYDYQTQSGTYVSGNVQCSGDYREISAKHVCTSSTGSCSSEITTTYTPNPATGLPNPTSNTIIQGGNTSMDVRDPLGNRTRYNFEPVATGQSGTPETDRFIYQGESTLLKTIHTDYGVFSLGFIVSPLPTQVTTTLNDISPNLTSKTVTTYDKPALSNGGNTSYINNPSEIDEYDFGTTTPTRQTTFTWQKGGNFDLDTAHILDRLASKTITDTSSGTQSTTSYLYDVLGNAQSVTRGGTNTASATTQYLTSSYGDLTQITDPKGNPPTKFAYANPWTDANCAAGAVSSGRPSSVTDALGHVSTLSYYSCTGLLATRTDPNGAITRYTYDSLGRLTQVRNPDQGQTTKTFVDTTPQSITSSSVINIQGQTISNKLLLDGLGRPYQSQLLTDPSGIDYVDTTYDPLERISTVSNPYRSTGDPSYGITTTQYDALNRTTLVIPPDGTSTTNNLSTNYSGNCTTTVDETGRSRKDCSDAMGRLIEVDEPTGGTSPTPGTGSATMNGTELSTSGPGAVAGSGSSTVTGTEQSITASSTSGQGSVSISGAERSIHPCGTSSCPLAYDGETLSILVNGVVAGSTSYGNTSSLSTTPPSPIPTAGSLATLLVTAINQNTNSVVSAALSGTSTIKLTSKSAGASTNYSLSVQLTSTIVKAGFPPASFTMTPSGSALTGGTTGATTYDSGTTSVTVNGTPYSVSYGQNSSLATVASALASAMTNGSLVNATANSSGVITIVAKATGAATNYPLSCGSSTSLPASFSSPSFAVSCASLTGGRDVGPTVYDSGSVWVTVGSFQATANYGQGSTGLSVASDIASSFNGSSASPVFATASGITINLVTKNTGASASYSLSAGATSSQPGTFPQPSFSPSVSGSTLAGSNGTPGSLTAPLVTLYKYDALGNLTCVEQHGGVSGTGCSGPPSGDATSPWRVRRFSYDALSRLLSTSNPESGAITYAYDLNGNLLSKTSAAPNQTGATTITLSYCYDALNRLTAKAYTSQACTNGTLPSPVATYLYDQATFNGLTISNGIGRRTGMTDPVGAEAWTYDPMGRPLADQRTNSGIVRSTTYSYNFDGSIATLGYPSGRVVTYQPSGAGRTLWAKDIPNSVVYAGGTCGPNGDGACYSPFGALSLLSNNGAGIVSTLYYNNRLQPCRISVKAAGTAPSSCSDTANIGNLLDYSYNFSLGAADNGNVTAITNNRDNTRSQSFNYDALNRLASAQTQTSGVTIPNSNCWGLTFGYDAWGNLLSSFSTGPTGCGEPLPLNVSATLANQFGGYCYDAAGNMLDSGACPTAPNPHAFVYDPENHLVSAAGISYSYDGDGRRMSKSIGKLYWYGIGTDPLDETDTAGNVTDEYIFFNGIRIAHRDSGSNVVYYFSDHLGTARVVASSTGAIQDDSDFYPFGGERPYLSSSNNHYKFTGKHRDSESGLDDFGARYFGSSLGRFQTPDPLLNSGRPWDSQTWNRYSYARNNPLNNVDPNGLYDLVNHCHPGDKKCDKEFRRHADDLKKGLSDLQKKVDKMKDGSQKQRLQAALTAFGTEGDHNGVNVGFDKLEGDAAGQTKYQSNDIGQLTANVTFDAGKIKSSNEYAIDAAHEGTHIEDTLTEAVNDYIAHGSLPGLTDFSREYRGYQTSVFAASALGMNSFSRSLDGASYLLWNGSWGRIDRNITNYITKFHDKDGKPNHPETTPHNPWPN